MKKFETVRTLTPADVAALEQRVAANPQDFDTRERLVCTYRRVSTSRGSRRCPGSDATRCG